VKGRPVLAAAAVVALAVLPTGRASRAADQSLETYGADASGTSIHALGQTNALTNFRTGFIDNSYPLASSHLDASPATQATATVADTGPLGSTAQSQAPTVLVQPQYAIATYPGQANAATAEGPSIAEAAAEETAASAHSAAAAVGADEAASRVSVNRTTGDVDASSTSHVQRAAFGANVLVISGVDVRASVTANGGKATPHYDISVASATVNGTPVAITDKGVVAAEPVPGSDAAAATINEQLNQALAGAGINVFVTPPLVDVKGTQATVFASGVHVVYTAPAVDPSVPTLTIEYVLGEARAFGFAVAGEPATESPSIGATVDLGSDIGTVAGAVTPLVPQPSSGLRRAGTGAQVGAGALPVSYRRPRPTWLVPMYLIWQALVLATAGVLVWSRRDVGA
jgi:hypothetical protein